MFSRNFTSVVRETQIIMWKKKQLLQSTTCYFEEVLFKSGEMKTLNKYSLSLEVNIIHKINQEHCVNFLFKDFNVRYEHILRFSSACVAFSMTSQSM